MLYKFLNLKQIIKGQLNSFQSDGIECHKVVVDKNDRLIYFYNSEGLLLIRSYTFEY